MGDRSGPLDVGGIEEMSDEEKIETIFREFRYVFACRKTEKEIKLYLTINPVQMYSFRVRVQTLFPKQTFLYQVEL